MTEGEIAGVGSPPPEDAAQLNGRRPILGNGNPPSRCSLKCTQDTDSLLSLTQNPKSLYFFGSLWKDSDNNNDINENSDNNNRDNNNDNEDKVKDNTNNKDNKCPKDFLDVRLLGPTCQVHMV